MCIPQVINAYTYNVCEWHAVTFVCVCYENMLTKKKVEGRKSE